jgi:hypothetical protein
VESDRPGLRCRAFEGEVRARAASMKSSLGFESDSKSAVRSFLNVVERVVECDCW